MDSAFSRRPLRVTVTAVSPEMSLAVVPFGHPLALRGEAKICLVVGAAVAQEALCECYL